jgi:hypothetical protein
MDRDFEVAHDDTITFTKKKFYHLLLLNHPIVSLITATSDGFEQQQ